MLAPTSSLAGSATRKSSSSATKNYWRGKPAFERVIIRHISDSAAQLLSIRRSDIDIAFNLIPEQIATLKSDPNVRLEALTSLDFVYMALTQNAEFNKALAVKEARQAIGHAIDYDGIVKNLLGGAAVRCANFLPIGVSARPRRSPGRSATIRTSTRRSSFCRRPASPTASNSRSPMATPRSPV